MPDMVARACHPGLGKWKQAELASLSNLAPLTNTHFDTQDGNILDFSVKQFLPSLLSS